MSPTSQFWPTFTTFCDIFETWESTKSHVPLTFQVLKDAGLIAGGDMTPEAALSKLSYVLAKNDLDIDAKKKVGVYIQSWYCF